jgi:SH3-like domain-containing protein
MLYRFILALLCSVLLAQPVLAAEAEDMGEAEGKAKLTLPRFGILRYGEINARTGPGTRYPIDWVYRQAGLPVEVIDRFDNWYQIKDAGGSKSWVQQSKIRWQRRGMVLSGMQTLHAEATPHSAVTAKLMPQALFDIMQCDTRWCLIAGKAADDGASFKGYLPQNTLFGVYPQETLP